MCVFSCSVIFDCNFMDCSCQTPLSMGFPRQEYWSGLPFPSPGNLPDLGIEPASPGSSALQANSLPLSHQRRILYSFPGGSEVKVSSCNVGDLGSIPEPGRSPGEGNGNPLQYFCLENPTDGGAWWAIQSTGLQRAGHDWGTSLSLLL